VSKIKTLYDNEWLSLKEVDDYIFSHESRSNGRLVSILVYTLKNGKVDKVLGRYERCPAHRDGIALTSITGGVEDGKIRRTAVQELFEEAGYEAEPEDLQFLGTTRPSKSADTTMYCFAFNGTGRKRRRNSIGDGTKGEEGAYCDWISADKAIHCKDPHMCVMLLRLENVLG
jgi:8-oxo-dGTP pyrophosphatase MutT (NUDIX family)